MTELLLTALGRLPLRVRRVDAVGAGACSEAMAHMTEQLGVLAPQVHVDAGFNSG